MKKTILLTVQLALFLTVAQAQTTVTIATGLHASSTSINQNKILNVKPITTFTGGIIIDQSLDNLLSVSSGILYKKKGFQVSESAGTEVLGIDLPIGVKATTTVNYVEIPALLKVNFTKAAIVQPYLAIGPSVAYAVSGNLNTKATAILDFNVMDTPLKLDSPTYNRTQLVGNALAGAYIPYGAGHWMVELGYSKSFTDLISDDFVIDAGGKQKGWSVTVGFGTRF